MSLYISLDIYPTDHHSFLPIFVFLCDHFPLVWRTSLNIFLQCSMSVHFCLSGNAFVSPLLFRSIFYEYRYLGCQFVRVCVRVGASGCVCARMDT